MEKTLNSSRINPFNTTRRTLMEARLDGIHCYCFTIDKQTREYLAHMYGAAAYTVIEEVHQLPLKGSNIYQRLTT